MCDLLPGTSPEGSSGYHPFASKVCDAMWCRNCQQDVPAVTRGASSPLVCPRCEMDLPVPTVAVDSAVAREISDVGIALDTRLQPALSEPPFEMLAQEQLQLSRIARKLGCRRRKSQFADRLSGTNSSGKSILGQEPISSDDQSSLRIDWAHAVSPRANASREAPAKAADGQRWDAPNASIGYQESSQPSRATPSWLLSMLLLGGVFGFTCGIGLLTHAILGGQGVNLPGGPIWQVGLTTTLAGEGMLIVGLTWMAIRLWRNGRRVNRQLQGVDRQLAELQHQSDELRSMRTSSSAAFYDHFAQATSSPMLLANLRGGLDQLAKRLQ